MDKLLTIYNKTFLSFNSYLIIMIFKRLIPLFVGKNAFAFSNLKNRLFQLKKKSHNNLKQLYEDMELFQRGLTYNEWLKYQKLTQEFDKKYTRIRSKSQEQFNFPLKNTITSQYFYQKDTIYAFNKNLVVARQDQPQIKTLTPSELITQTKKYVNFDMECYHKFILPTPTNYKSFMEKINLRFQNIEEILCRHVFKGYEDFSTFEQNLFFKKQTKYKGDFKFQIVQNVELFQQISPIIKNISLFNQNRSKVSLASELILAKYWKNLSQQALANYLFSVSLRGKQLHQISASIGQIYQKLPNHQFQLLFYTSTTGCQCQAFLQHIKQQKQINQTHQLSQFQYFIYKLLIQYNQKTKQTTFEWADSIIKKGQNYLVKENDMLDAFIRYLQDKHYQYKLVQDQNHFISPNKIIQIQDRKFVCLTHLFYTEEGKPNGLYKLISLYLSQFRERTKFINPHQTLFKQTLNKKEEYFQSKMKGLKKPNYKKPSKFDFIVPLQERQQQQKQRQASQSQK